MRKKNTRRNNAGRQLCDLDANNAACFRIGYKQQGMFQNRNHIILHATEFDPNYMICFRIRFKHYNIFQNSVQPNVTSLAPELCVTKCPPEPLCHTVPPPSSVSQSVPTSNPCVTKCPLVSVCVCVCVCVCASMRGHRYSIHFMYGDAET